MKVTNNPSQSATQDSYENKYIIGCDPVITIVFFFQQKRKKKKEKKEAIIYLHDIIQLRKQSMDILTSFSAFIEFVVISQEKRKEKKIIESFMLEM